MNRSEYELSIIATELSGLMAKIEKRKTPQLRAMLRESRERHGQVTMSYAAMRGFIVRTGELFAVRREADASVTPEPGFVRVPRTIEEARRDFA